MRRCPVHPLHPIHALHLVLEVPDSAKGGIPPPTDYYMIVYRNVEQLSPLTADDVSCY